MIGKNIVLCVCGGIAAYKSASLASKLVKMGAEVFVCMTESAQKFISPLTFETLTKHAVITDTFDRSTTYEVSHISLAKRADAVVIAPATANIIAKTACGIADDYITTMLLATKAPTLYVPSMNTAMLENGITQRNIRTLAEFGKHFAESDSGLLACGDVGKGRYPDEEVIIEKLESILAKRDLEGLNVLVTAGPTTERIDAVRYLTNRSTGKMGYSIAKAAAMRGANVTLVSGRRFERYPAGVKVVDVDSAQDMYEAVLANFDDADIVIKAAAVADYTPANKQTGKMKKGDDFALELVRTTDILKELGAKKNGQVLVGFSAETSDLEKNAQGKLKRKNLDMIVANDVSRSDIGFGTDENAVTIYFADGRVEQLEKAPKPQIASSILDFAHALL